MQKIYDEKINLYLQAQSRCFDSAVCELINGKKETHWMWYIFPQLTGLGLSEDSFRYGLYNLEETKIYYNHPVLGQRLKNLCKILLNSTKDEAEDIFGFLDSLKLRSCMTIFYIATGDKLFKQVLNKYFQGKMDEKTITLLNNNGELS